MCHHGNYYSNDGEIHSGHPLMHHDVHHILAEHLTKLLYDRNVDGAGCVKEYMLGNEDNLEFHTINIFM
jgi:hypothetical protein